MRLSEALNKRNVETWLDGRDVEPGAGWDEAVVAAIESASGFVFLIGKSDPADREQNFEWQQVVNREYYLDALKPLIPVLIGSPEIPGFLKARRALFLDGTRLGCEELADKIVRILQDPASCVDLEKLALGREARKQALDSFKKYSQVLREEDIKRAGLRAVD